MAFWFCSSLTFQFHPSLVELYSVVALIVGVVSITTDGITSSLKGLQKM